MAWFSRFTRFGDMHLVFGQEANMSCGIASVLMCVFKINKITPGAQAVHINKDIYDAYSKASGGTYQPEKVGTHPNHLVTVLNGLKCGKWMWSQVAAGPASQKIIDLVGVTAAPGPTLTVNPIIIGVDWDSGGAHWAVIDTVRSLRGTHYATICDPWDANVHVQAIKAGTPFTYKADEGGYAIDMWGAHKGQTSPYKPGAKGRIQTWGIIHRIA
ncbi:hypothetical protein F1188_16545 [Roseospira marina]|uniref:Peptidase C39-like domain-containing protein n=1 Tax=Roseospira marina TaxID=140057 RepID=A0A5M6I7U2_9PROT|nr:hypothetical protein [Roseospira marina]KAA5604301.1 hypothetical protein F1188_16545 [Roseospira marina]MBB4315675.1 hypothetical protein [Roseospira marina]MBB5088733.1 hypothetical protein [Roseospira marina]